MSMNRKAYLGPFLKVDRNNNNPLWEYDLNFDHPDLEPCDVLRELRGKEGCAGDPFWFYGPNRDVDGLHAGVSIDEQCMTQWAEFTAEAIAEDLKLFQENELVKMVVNALNEAGYETSFAWGVVMGVL